MEKNMWRKWVADYFTFSRKERWAVIVLVIIILLLLFLPRFIPETQTPLVAEDSLAMAVIKSWQRDSPKTQRPFTEESAASPGSQGNQKLFYFDPNKTSPAEWMRLGVREKTALTIKRFLDRGGRFRNADDLDKIYGLPAALVEKLKPYVRIRDLPDQSGPVTKNEWTTKKRELPKVNLNTADSLSLVALPGIGPTLAVRIIRYRDKLGGFYRIGQLLEVYGIRDSLLIALTPYIEPDTGYPRQLDINSISREELKEHPYFRGPLANAVINYREAHGPYQSIDDLRKIHLADSGWIRKVEPYCKIR